MTVNDSQRWRSRAHRPIHDKDSRPCHGGLSALSSELPIPEHARAGAENCRTKQICNTVGRHNGQSMQLTRLSESLGEFSHPSRHLVLFFRGALRCCGSKTCQQTSRHPPLPLPSSASCSTAAETPLACMRGCQGAWLPSRSRFGKGGALRGSARGHAWKPSRSPPVTSLVMAEHRMAPRGCCSSCSG